MTWRPAAGWQPLTSGTGQSNVGVWRTPEGWVVKRLVPGVDNPRHHAYWRRQPLLAESRLLEATPGLRSPTCLKVEWDEGGATIWTAEVSPATDAAASPAANGRSPGAGDPLFLAVALGRFAQAHVPEPSWGARDVLRDRLATVAGRGGWGALDPELPADLRHVVRDLWVRRDAALAELDALPRVPTHGDAHPGNLIGRDGEDVIAIDWEQFGLAPTGFDLGYLILAVDLPLDDLLAAYALADRPPNGEQEPSNRMTAANLHAVRRGAVLTAAYTAISRAAWSLTQPDPGDHLTRLLHLSNLIAEANGEPTR
ncbi:phosphotransferase [Kribbella sp. NPDC006257]|uniref:phosphotransferase family protein n=1 Tax=Kribbella sp. NPDC006257 TaxID=3156738 RepID=UPI0033A1A24B